MTTADVETETNAKFILKAIRFHSPIQEECDSLEDAIILACSWSELRGALYVGWAAVTCIEDEAGNVVMDEKTLRDAINERDW